MDESAKSMNLLCILFVKQFWNILSAYYMSYIILLVSLILFILYEIIFYYISLNEIELSSSLFLLEGFFDSVSCATRLTC